MPLGPRLAAVRRFRHALVEQAEAVAQDVTDASPWREQVSETLSAEVIPIVDACRFLERRAKNILKPRRVASRQRPLWLWGTSSVVHRDPWGLVLILAPNNYPLFLPGAQMLQALVAGNAVLLKPGKGGTPAARNLHGLAKQAGFGERVQLLDESIEAGTRAIETGVDHVVLTGSAETGRAVARLCAERLTPTTMELSGCDAMLLLPGCDLKLATQALAFGQRLNQARTCIAPHALFIPESMQADFAQALQAQGLALPEPSEPMDEDRFEPGYTLSLYQNTDEAVQRINAKRYALGCSVFGTVDQARAIARRIEVGTVTINDLIAPTADPRLPFTGRRQSGFGPTRGEEGLLAMTQPKVILTNKSPARPHYEPPTPTLAGLFSSYLRAMHGRTHRFASMKQLLRQAQLLRAEQKESHT